jgi:hypothetical protein
MEGKTGMPEFSVSTHGILNRPLRRKERNENLLMRANEEIANDARSTT